MPDTADHLRGEIPRTEVDDHMLARILRCDELSIRKYARAGIIQREKNKKFALFQAIGGVVEHLRAMAGRQGTGDAMKAGAALKDAQRRLTEMKLAKLDGQLLAMAELEAIWGDLAASAKWLFLAIPGRAQAEFGLPNEYAERLSLLCASMLREVAFTGQMQLATVEPSDGDDDDGDDSESPAADRPTPH